MWWRIGTPVVILACGALFVVSAVDANGTDLRPGRYTSLATLVGSEATSTKKLQNQVAQLQQQVDELANSVPGNQIKKFQANANALKAPAGLQGVEGAGLSITLSDAPSELVDSTDLDPNLLVVHQQDIQAVVNALWNGGATAITIQGERIVSTTGIKCSGSTVELQGIPYPQPYVIQAVGDPSKLQESLAVDSYVQLYEQQAADPRIGIGWNLSVDNDVKAPAYKGPFGFSYATPLS